MTAYYNEFDPFAAAWLEELIKAKLIAPGVVDRRSIVDVRPSELLEFTQCHFFAGIGVWSYALRLAGWPDDRPIWTGSCPCQPFSGAGKGGGFDDERHLWPHFYWLISNCRPSVIVGEQVASKDGLHWLDLVQADLEGQNYTNGAIDTCSAGVGAPHQRQRLYWMAYDNNGQSWQGRRLDQAPREGLWAELGRRCEPEYLVHAGGAGLEGFRRDGDDSDQPRWIGTEQDRSIAATGVVGSLEYADSQRSFSAPHGRVHSGKESSRARNGEFERSDQVSCMEHDESDGRLERWAEPGERSIIVGRSADSEHETAGPLNGFWRSADWLFCRDERWRAVEPGTFPLANGVAGRVGLLRGYGNAINAYSAKIFVEAVDEILEELA